MTERLRQFDPDSRYARLRLHSGIFVVEQGCLFPETGGSTRLRPPYAEGGIPHVDMHRGG